MLLAELDSAQNGTASLASLAAMKEQEKGRKRRAKSQKKYGSAGPGTRAGPYGRTHDDGPGC